MADKATTPTEDNTPAAAEIIDQFKGKQDVNVQDFIDAHFY